MALVRALVKCCERTGIVVARAPLCVIWLQLLIGGDTFMWQYLRGRASSDVGCKYHRMVSLAFHCELDLCDNFCKPCNRGDDISNTKRKP
ncbi:uncharacterized protein LJ206_010953 isoform 2-T3 [Theristicus caerulescens]